MLKGVFVRSPLCRCLLIPLEAFQPLIQLSLSPRCSNKKNGGKYNTNKFLPNRPTCHWQPPTGDFGLHGKPCWPREGPRALNCFHATLTPCLAGAGWKNPGLSDPLSHRELLLSPTLCLSCPFSVQVQVNNTFDANTREGEARKHLTLTPFPPSPPFCELKQIIVKAKAHLGLLSRLCPSYLGSSLSLLEAPCSLMHL